MEGIGTTTWMWEVEFCLEQEPRVEPGTETESNAGAVADDYVSACTLSRMFNLRRLRPIF